MARLEGSKVYFDTKVFIGALNTTPVVAALRIFGLTGDVTMAELLVKPPQVNDAPAVGAVKELLVDDGDITLAGRDRAAFELAAQHRARHGLKMVAALQLATAQLAGARCVILNDRQFPPLPDIECLSLAG